MFLEQSIHMEWVMESFSETEANVAFSQQI